MDDRTLSDTLWDIHGCIDGYVVTFHGEFVGQRPTFAKASALLHKLRQAAAEAEDELVGVLARRAA